MLKVIKYVSIFATIFSVVTFFLEVIFFIEKFDLIDLGTVSIARDDDSSSGVAVNASIGNSNVKNVVTMLDSQIINKLTGGVLTSVPTYSAPPNASEIETAVEKQIVEITVPIRAWEDENDSSNMNIVTKNMTLKVNSTLSDVWTEFFTDLYNGATDFVIVSAECYRANDSDCNNVGYKSGHTYGAAVDINSKDNEKYYSKKEWEKLPENHLKHQIIYEDSNVEKIAHKYTLYWGGEETEEKKDIAHFSFICDGKSRINRLQTYGT